VWYVKQVAEREGLADGNSAMTNGPIADLRKPTNVEIVHEAA
jgi:hypothetical protein